MVLTMFITARNANHMKNYFKCGISLKEWRGFNCRQHQRMQALNKYISNGLSINKANLRDLIAATGLAILLKLDSNRRFFARVTLKFDGWPRKIIRHVFYTTSSFNLCIISDPSGNSNWRYSPETANLGQNRRFLEPCDLPIWRMTLKNNRAPLLFYFKLCASFRSHWWIQTWVTVRKPPIWVKFDDF